MRPRGTNEGEREREKESKREREREGYQEDSRRREIARRERRRETLATRPLVTTRIIQTNRNPRGTERVPINFEMSPVKIQTRR